MKAFTRSVTAAIDSAFDNELPRHKVYLAALQTCGPPGEQCRVPGVHQQPGILAPGAVAFRWLGHGAGGKVASPFVLGGAFRKLARLHPGWNAGDRHHTSRCATSATTRLMPSRAGRARAFPARKSGKSWRQTCRSPETCRNRGNSIPSPPSQAAPARARCLAMCGNGPEALIWRIPAISRHPARSANITASSCATSSCCAEVPALLRIRIFEPATETSFLQARAGSSRAFDWHKTAIKDKMATSREISAVPTIAADVLGGLSRPQKCLSPKLFYDARGSELFEQICELPEYYLTRTERAILADNIDLSSPRPPAMFTRWWNSGREALRKRRCCCKLWRGATAWSPTFPIDVSGSALQVAARQLRTRVPQLRVAPVVADYTREMPLRQDPGPRLILYIGSSIGNFEPMQAAALLARGAPRRCNRPTVCS